MHLKCPYTYNVITMTKSKILIETLNIQPVPKDNQNKTLNPALDLQNLNQKTFYISANVFFWLNT